MQTRGIEYFIRKNNVIPHSLGITLHPKKIGLGVGPGYKPGPNAGALNLPPASFKNFFPLTAHRAA